MHLPTVRRLPAGAFALTEPGELMLFALPDAMIVLGIRIASYHVGDEHQRAMRQMMILGLVVAATFCSILYALILLHPDSH
jgi:hypothetical protein